MTTLSGRNARMTGSSRIDSTILPLKHKPFFKGHEFKELSFGGDTKYVYACIYDYLERNDLYLMRRVIM